MFQVTASDTSSRIRNDAVRTKLIAPILDLDIRAGMLCCMSDLHLLIFFLMVDIKQLFFYFMLSIVILVQNRDQVFLFIISNYDVHTRVDIFSSCLHITACRHNYRIRVHFPCFMKHLPGFAVCNIGNCTCIDNIDICPFFKWHDLISILLQKLLHSLCLICIYFAAQIMERSFLFHFTHSFQNIWYLFLDFYLSYF